MLKPSPSQAIAPPPGSVPAAASAIEVDGLYFAYDGEWVLEDVHLSIPERTFLAVLGPNGSGKTTLLKLLLGILKPARGRVRVFDKAPELVSERFGYVPQNTNINQSFPVSVGDVVLMGRLGRGLRLRRRTKRDQELVRTALERVGMWSKRDRKMAALSGGERQRVLIARALAVDPRVLFMDEPTASVDAVFQTELYSLLKTLNETMTIVVVSHDLSVLSSYVGAVACVNRKVFYHDSAELTTEMIDRVYHCPVELIAHGFPHRVLRDHRDS
ncbi:MAG: ABC transporter [Syntrophobacteraceae bacterium CG07_land_8_20_14_0_80_61_8]|nr:MAG: ABC transporter [Syntrophobacteraceae bacterium CG07_land_8_20_14_0_80_61_8]